MTAHFAATPTEDYTAQEFSIGNVKFIVLDDDPTLIPKYAPHFKKAQSILQSKGFGKLWYGHFFLMPRMIPRTELEIRAYEMAGYRRTFIENNAGFYSKAVDEMALLQPPGTDLIYGTVHEMGHRMWFKHLSGEQRGRFESFLRFPVREEVTPAKVIDYEENVTRMLVGFDTARKTVLDVLAKFTGSKVAWYDKILTMFEDPLFRAGREFSTGMPDVLHSSGAPWNKQVAPQFNQAMHLAEMVYMAMNRLPGKLRTEMNNAPDMPREDFRKHFKKAQSSEVKKILVLLEETRAAAREYAIDAIQLNNLSERERVEKYPKFRGTGDVDPVTEYGTSNVEEAFAEVFAKYVLNMDMTRDQVNSFKAVLKKLASARAVVDRYLAR
jgi:hypothetical protein